MQELRHVAAALLAVVVLGTGTARGASTTNFTDQWWNADESGWGAAVLQQWDTLFIDMFVFGSDNNPTWFVAAAKYQSGSPGGHAVFTGDLYTATGPYYGAPFNSSPTSSRKVGTLTFDADAITTATLSYTVDGTPVTKNVTRQTWRSQSLGGRYFGGVSGQTPCFGSELLFIDIVHNADDSITLKFTEPALGVVVLTVEGTYTQSGHMGTVAGAATGGLSGTANLYEIESSIAGVTGRGHVVITAGADACTWDGRWGGVRR